MTEAADIIRDKRRHWAAPGGSHDRKVRILARWLPGALGGVPELPDAKARSMRFSFLRVAEDRHGVRRFESVDPRRNPRSLLWHSLGLQRVNSRL